MYEPELDTDEEIPDVSLWLEEDSELELEDE